MKLKIALDWTPNSNHIGFLVAKELGYYKEYDIDLEIISVSVDQYTVSPGKKLELDIVDLAMAPFETVISLNNKEEAVHTVAIYTVLQSDLSRVVSLKSSNISSPKDLDGRTYASYKERYQDRIITEMVKNDGGTGALNFIYPEKLGVWNILLTGTADAAWIFDNWEGVDAGGKDVPLDKFTLSDYNIPYGYSPVVLTKKKKLDEHKEHYSNFIKATKKGYLYAKEHVSESVSILKQYVTEYDLKNIDLEKSLAITIPYFGDETNCGVIQPDRVSSYLQWLVDNGIEDKVILGQTLFINELFLE